MSSAIISFIRDGFGLRRLIGPILDKEMRVSSRRKSSYILRFAYLLCLTVFVALTWHDVTEYWDFQQMTVHAGTNGNPVYQTSAPKTAAFMAQAGETIVKRLLWFQFYAAQLMAMFMLSSAIPSEIVRGTMIPLACTPMSHFQIVWGKLISRLLQVILLVAVSLPLLALIRVFGGVAWGTVIAGLAVTLSATVMIGAWSLMLSVRNHSVLKIVVLTSILYATCAVVGLRVEYLENLPLGPVIGMFIATEGMNAGGVAIGGLSFSRPVPAVMLVIVNCMLMLAAAFIFLHIAGNMLRTEVAMPRARKKRQRRAALPPPLPWEAGQPTYGTSPPAPRRPGELKGAAIIWKDLRTFLPARRSSLVLAITLTLGIITVSYLPFASSNSADFLAAHTLFICLYLCTGSFVTLLASSTAITVEKESRALPILLTAPITDTDVIISKAKGVFYRGLVCWGLLAIHLLLFSAVGQIHPAGAAAIAAIAVYMGVFLTGLGLYVSSRLKSSSNALTCALGICVLLWGILPLLASMLPEETGDLGSVFEGLNPFAQISAITSAYIDSPIGYRIPFRTERFAAAGNAPAIVLSLLGYTAAGIVLAQRAKILMRRKLFG